MLYGKINTRVALGADVGGSHITTALMNVETGVMVADSICHKNIATDGSNFIDKLLQCIEASTSNGREMVTGLSFAIPGPFIYDKGVCVVDGVAKFEKLFALDLRHTCQSFFRDNITGKFLTTFINDAQAFLLGAVNTYQLHQQNVIGITLGTGIGSAFYKNKQIVSAGNDMPANGYVYNIPYKDGIAEDYISSRWIIRQYDNKSVKEIAALADKGDEKAIGIFKTIGNNLGEILKPLIKKFNADTLVLGGGILHAWHLFRETFEAFLNQQEIHCNILVTLNTEEMNISGAIQHLNQKKQTTELHERKTEQYLLPKIKPAENKKGSYNIYPTHTFTNGSINTDLTHLIELLPQQGSIIIDGYGGVFWEKFVADFSKALAEKNKNAIWYCVDAALKPAAEIERIIAPSLNMHGEDSIFGKLYPGTIADFFDAGKLKKINPAQNKLNIVYGCGAALTGWKGIHIYIDIPKNEIQFRSRAGAFKNLGADAIANAKAQYKRAYFIDWPVLNLHKQRLLPLVDYVIDGQQTEFYSWTTGEVLRTTLEQLSQSSFRVRPWFEPGVWGGQWMKNNIDTLPQNVPNYAWSFELIVPENGLLLEDDGRMFELSFDWLMFAYAENILGNAYKKFGTYFPIRFDYLDTMDGDNLSVQCHPSPEYCKENFGELITQDETYYIIDQKDDSVVYIGFEENIEPEDFQEALENSFHTKEKIDITQFVQSIPSKKHDLFLIPNKTIHGSGANNLVLEISNTPYIFTFKLYDWVRPDLEGNLRPINIDHGMKNLDFTRKGEKVKEELISKPSLIAEGKNFAHWHLPTHKEHIYDVERYEWEGTLTIETNGQCHLLMLVEDGQVAVATGGRETTYNYAETIVVPAAAKNYTITYIGQHKGLLVKAFVKDSYCNN